MILSINKWILGKKLLSNETNLALNKPAFQKDTNNGHPYATAGKAVDGSDSTIHIGGSCIMTHPRLDAWWYVDLQVSVS